MSRRRLDLRAWEFFQRTPFTVKLGTIILLPLGLIVLLSFLFIIKDISRNVTRDIHRQAKEVTHLAIQHISSHRPFPDKTFLDKIIDDLAAQYNIVYAVIIGNNNKIISHSNHIYDNTWPRLEMLPDQEAIFHEVQPIVIGEWQVATLQIGFSEQTVLNEISQSKIRLFLITLLTGSFGLLLATAFIRYINHRLHTLARQAREIEQGNFDLQLTYKGSDAMGVLIEAFNHMAFSLKQTLDDLEAERAGLEKTVQKRTAQLSATLGRLADANLQLQEANITKSRFLASISHELRTPLNGILGTSSLLQEQFFGPLTEKQVEYVTQIEQSATHLLSLINDLLDMAKVDSGTMQLEYSIFDISECITSTLAMMEALFRAKELKVSTREETAMAIEADYRKCRQILFNLLANAIKFSEPKGHITVTTQKIDQIFMKISVTDRGAGIAPEEQEKIFSEFYQADTRQNHQLGGTGLGLALCRRLVELHGGKIGVVSTLDKGSTFWFTLPLKRPLEPTRDLHSPQPS